MLIHCNNVKVVPSLAQMIVCCNCSSIWQDTGVLYEVKTEFNLFIAEKRIREFKDT